MIEIYGKSNCKWCKMAVELARARSLPYQYLAVDDDYGLYEQLKEKLPEVKTVPQIWWNSRHLGGYTEFAQEVENTVSDYGHGKI